MAKIPTDVDGYIAAQPAAARAALQRVRRAIKKAVPGAVESLSYGMPTYRLPVGPVLYFAGWKEHYSLYPATAGVLAAFGDELATYEVQKGTIRFPLAQPVPAPLIARIAKLRAKETTARATAASKRAGAASRTRKASAAAKEPGAEKKRAAAKTLAATKKRVTAPKKRGAVAAKRKDRARAR